jgi:hypothetical protein
MIAGMNIGLLAFNLLPFYPLDGGQILQSILWFFVGRARSLAVVAHIGFIGVALLGVYTIYRKSLWIGLIAFYAFGRCRAAAKQAERLLIIDELPPRPDHCCPECNAAPPVGDIWRCSQCKTAFDPFDHHGICPQCQTPDDSIQCITCKTIRPLVQWRTAPLSLAVIEPHSEG